MQKYGLTSQRKFAEWNKPDTKDDPSYIGFTKKIREEVKFKMVEVKRVINLWSEGMARGDMGTFCSYGKI